MSRSNQAGGGAGNGGSGGGNSGSGTPRRDLLPAVLVSALAAVTVTSLFLSYIAVNQLMSTEFTGPKPAFLVVPGALLPLLPACKRGSGAGGDEDDEKRVRAEIKQSLEGQGVSCAGKWEISRPVVFRPGVGDEVAGQIDEKSIRRFMERPALRKAANVYVFGLASADGPREINELLARQRAWTVKEAIQRDNPTIAVEVHGLGEDHLTNSVTSSRSARIVACVPRG